MSNFQVQRNSERESDVRKKNPKIDLREWESTHLDGTQKKPKPDGVTVPADSTCYYYHY